MATIDKIALLLIKDKRVLMTRTYGKTAYYFPGGKREGDESDSEVLIREIKEELGVDIKPETINYIGTFSAQADGKPIGTFVESKFYKAEYNGELIPTSEIEELAWLSHSDAQKTSPLGIIVFDYLKNQNIID